MNLPLTREETGLLVSHLTQHLEHMDDELVHTDKRELQRSLAREIEALRRLTDRIVATSRGEMEPMPDIV